MRRARHLLLLLAPVVLGCQLRSLTREPRGLPAVQGALVQLTRSLTARNLPQLARLFDPQCRHSCRGFVPLTLVKGGGYEAASWVPRLDRREPALLDLARILVSYREVVARIVPLQMRVLQGRALARVRLELQGVDAEDYRRVDEGLVDLDLRQGPTGWKVHGFSPASVNTLRLDQGYRRRALALPQLEPAAPCDLSPPGQQGQVPWIALDVNHDGVPDLVMGRADEVLLLAGRRDGGFHAARPLFRQPRLRTLHAADLDGDGRVDLFAGSYGGTSRLWLARDGGRFEAAADFAVEGHVTAAATADLDGDGWLDLYVVRHGDPATWPRGPGEGNQLFVGGRGGLRLAMTTDKGWGLAVCAGDLDGDGVVDLFVANELGPSGLWINTGAGRFEERAAEAGLQLEQATSCALGDVNGDGRLDLLVGGRRGSQAYLFGRPGVGAPGDGLLPTRRGRARLRRAAAGDTLWINCAASPRSAPQGREERNSRPGDRLRFRPAGLRDVGWTSWAGMLDHDSDGKLDLLLLRRQPPPDLERRWWWQVLGPALRARRGARSISAAVAPGRPRLWVNLGCGGGCRFADGAAVTGADLGGHALGVDGDGDGRLELLTDGARRIPGAPRRGARTGARLSWEAEQQGHGVLLQLEGRAPNRLAVGSRVELWAEGRRQVREVGLSASGLPGGAPGQVHFGLGSALRAEVVVVRWPDGSRQRFVDLPSDCLVRLRQGGHASWGSEEQEIVDRPELVQRPPVAPSSAPAGWVAPRRMLELTVEQPGATPGTLSRHAGRRATLLLLTRTPADCTSLVRLARRRPGVKAVLVWLDGAPQRREDRSCPLPALRATPGTRGRFSAAAALLPLLVVVDGEGRTLRLFSGSVDELALESMLDGL